MDIIGVSYTLIKAEAAAKGLKFYYTQLYEADGTTTSGYNVFAMSPFYGLTTTITSAPDIADFEADIKPTATAVEDESAAQARAELAQLASVILPGDNSGRSIGYTATNAASSKTVRATTYTPQGTNQQRSVNSTNANDTAAGTGARKVKITYFNAAGEGPFTEIVTLNGVGAVNTVATNIALIEKMEVVEVGNGGGNAGTIQIFTLAAGGGVVWGSIAIGDNQTYWAHHYVPPNKICYVLCMEGASSPTIGGLTPNVANPLNALIPQMALDITMRHTNVNVKREYSVPIKVVGPAIVFLNERPDANTASTTFAGFAWIQQ